MGWWSDHLERKLRERPSGHPGPTDQDRYYDSETGVAGSFDLRETPPWTDDSPDHEAEL